MLEKIICSSLVQRDVINSIKNCYVSVKQLRLKESFKIDQFKSKLFVPAIMPINAVVEDIYEEYFTSWHKYISENSVSISSEGKLILDKDFCKEYIKLSMV